MKCGLRNADFGILAEKQPLMRRARRLRRPKTTELAPSRFRASLNLHLRPLASNAHIGCDFLTFAPQNLHVIVQI